VSQIHRGRAVLTIAVGRPVFVRMAVTLARSFAWWHRSRELRFVIATDQPELVPHIAGVDVMPLEPGCYGEGFSPKLYLDELAPADCTLLVDADCLCVGSLVPLFERFEGRSVSVIGESIRAGQFFCDVETMRAHFGLASLPWFVGGCYYIERGETARAVYHTARALHDHYDVLGFVRLRGRQNEEPLVAVAMAMHGQTPIPDDGTLKAEPMNYDGGISVDVLGGWSRLWESSTASARARPSLPFEARPRLVHFHADWIERDPYLCEARRLELVAKGWPAAVAKAITSASAGVRTAMRGAKNALRPAYRAIFGVRAVRQMARER
jgi:hypothetical protein